MRNVGRDSVIRLATVYMLDGLGIETRWGRDLPHLSIAALGLTHSHVQLVPGLFPGVKRPGRDVNHPPSSSDDVKERVWLHLYSPLWACMA
jgi:hypothetical protein